MAKLPLDTSLPKNLPLMLKERVQECPELNLQASKNKEGKFVYYSYKQVYDSVIALALAFKNIGIKKNSNVALISDNRREWLITDFALLSLGAADVPRGCDSMGNELRFIISYADCEVGIFENTKQLKKVTEKIEEVPFLKKVILFDAPQPEELNDFSSYSIEIISFENLLKKGIEIYNEDPAAKKTEIENSMEAVEPNDTATIIFTSGTTGTPKGVMLSHENYMTQLSAVPVLMPCKPGNWWMTILPVWHCFERLIQYVAPQLKCGLAYSKPIAPVLIADMATIRPQWICGVPRLWEALANGVNRTMNKTGGIKLKMYKFFLSVCKAYCNFKDMVLGHVCRIKKRNKFLDCLAGFIPFILLWPLHKLGDALVFSKIREKFGGRLGIAISGGGALQKDIDDFYRAVGLNLLEGYGLTETCPVISFRYYKEPRPGCVGAIFPTMEVKIVPEENGVMTEDRPLPPGEKGLILVRSKQVMKGYYKSPELTKQVIDENGWFNTGDLGLRTWDDELKITGRAKDTIVLRGGENVEPTVLEAELCTSQYIESAIVLGQDQKYLASLIVPSNENITAYAKDNGIEFTDYAELLKMPQIISMFNDVINTKISVANGYRICEKIFRFALLPDSFTVGDELSAKQEIMRFRIREKYKDIIASLFEE